MKKDCHAWIFFYMKTLISMTKVPYMEIEGHFQGARNFPPKVSELDGNLWLEFFKISSFSRTEKNKDLLTLTYIPFVWRGNFRQGSFLNHVITFKYFD